MVKKPAFRFIPETPVRRIIAIIIYLISVIFTLIVCLEFIDFITDSSEGFFSPPIEFFLIFIPYFLSIWGILSFDYYLNDKSSSVSHKLDIFRKINIVPQVLTMVLYWYVFFVGASTNDILLAVGLVSVFIAIYLMILLTLLSLMGLIFDKQYRIRYSIYIIFLSFHLYFTSDAINNMPLP